MYRICRVGCSTLCCCPFGACYGAFPRRYNETENILRISTLFQADQFCSELELRPIRALSCPIMLHTHLLRSRAFSSVWCSVTVSVMRELSLRHSGGVLCAPTIGYQLKSALFTWCLLTCPHLGQDRKGYCLSWDLQWSRVLKFWVSLSLRCLRGLMMILHSCPRIQCMLHQPITFASAGLLAQHVIVKVWMLDALQLRRKNSWLRDRLPVPPPIAFSTFQDSLPGTIRVTGSQIKLYVLVGKLSVSLWLTQPDCWQWNVQAHHHLMIMMMMWYAEYATYQRSTTDTQDIVNGAV
jgi:hypothetical protein